MKLVFEDMYSILNVVFEDNNILVESYFENTAKFALYAAPNVFKIHVARNTNILIF